MGTTILDGGTREKGYHMPLIDQERNEKLNKIKRKN